MGEGVLIGPSLFADTNSWRVVHADLGVLLLGLSLLLRVSAGLSRWSGRMSLPGAVLCVLTLIEVTTAVLGRRAPRLPALHLANALLMVGLCGGAAPARVATDAGEEG